MGIRPTVNSANGVQRSIISPYERDSRPAGIGFSDRRVTRSGDTGDTGYSGWTPPGRSTWGVVTLSGANPRRARIGRLSSEASTWT